MGKYKYCDDVDYKNDTYQAFSSQFKDRQDFEGFYSSLNNPETKNEFLRIGSTYLFFVKNGNWHVDIPRSNPVISYITDSFKLIALLAIIENLPPNNKYVDFFEWLSQKGKNELFPIADQSRLKELHDQYKSVYVSLRRCKSFFENLPPGTKKELCERIHIDGKPAEKIQKVVDLIYKERSRFAHECDFVLGISNCFHIAPERNKQIFWKQFSIEVLQNAFEEGVIIYFKGTQKT